MRAIIRLDSRRIDDDRLRGQIAIYISAPMLTASFAFQGRNVFLHDRIQGRFCLPKLVADVLYGSLRRVAVADTKAKHTGSRYHCQPITTLKREPAQRAILTLALLDHLHHHLNQLQIF